MKKQFAALLLIFSTFASAQSISLSPFETQDLKLNKSEVEIVVSYPGRQLSGICGVELRSNYDIKKIKSLISITPALGIDPVVRSSRHGNQLIIDLTIAGGMYMTSFNISTLDGRTLKETFNQLAPYSTVVLVTRSCR